MDRGGRSLSFLLCARGRSPGAVRGGWGGGQGETMQGYTTKYTSARRSRQRAASSARSIAAARAALPAAPPRAAGGAEPVHSSPSSNASRSAVRSLNHTTHAQFDGAERGRDERERDIGREEGGGGRGGRKDKENLSEADVGAICPSSSTAASSQMRANTCVRRAARADAAFNVGAQRNPSSQSARTKKPLLIVLAEWRTSARSEPRHPQRPRGRGGAGARGRGGAGARGQDATSSSEDDVRP